MKKIIKSFVFFVFISVGLKAQVTQINSNKSLNFQFPIGNKLLLISDIDSTLWVTDATAAGTVQLSSAIHFIEVGGMLNDKLIFTATTPATGAELFITDGTAAGTILLKDIYPGAAGSVPDDAMAELNGFLYFTADSPAEGRELWRTNGTTAGTTLVKDINSGTGSSNTRNDYNLFSSGTYLLMNIKNTLEGNELWKSDGTSAGTFLLKDINPGTLNSDPDHFYLYNNMVIFSARKLGVGRELWKTNGTSAGTELIKDINPGEANGATSFFFYPFQNKLFFSANNGVTGDEIWSTDGTTANTVLLKDIESGPLSSYASLFTAVNIGSKIIFSAFNSTNGFELWETDGTTIGTKLFKDIIPGTGNSFASIFPLYLGYNGSAPPLFQGNKFFFMAHTVDEGNELWVSDGTPAGTTLVKDIKPGDEDGLETFSFMYTNNAFYFAANNGTTGHELWKSDGTNGGTVQVAEINPGAGDADIFFSFFLVNNKLLFQATNGDHPTYTDLYRLDADQSPLPVKLLQFTASASGNDAVLQWSTAQEINSKDFTVQRSVDGINFQNIGTVQAVGNSTIRQAYNYTDRNALSTAKDELYYRLISNDKDGKSATSKVATLKIKSGWNVKLNSNPVQQSHVSLSITGNANNTQLSIIDATGKTILQQSAKVSNGVITIPATSLAPGIYILVAQQQDERKVIRFVKQ